MLVLHRYVTAAVSRDPWKLHRFGLLQAMPCSDGVRVISEPVAQGWDAKLLLEAIKNEITR